MSLKSGIALTSRALRIPDRLAQVGDWIIECATAAELWARFQDGSV